MAGPSDNVHNTDHAVLVGKEKMSQINVELVATATAEIIKASANSAQNDKEEE